jgi:outer membrane protein insertion porin family
MNLRPLLVLSVALGLLVLGLPAPAQAQMPNQMPNGGGQSPATSSASTYRIGQIKVQGIDNERTKDFVIQSSGLSVGQKVTLPSGTAVAEAIRAIYDLRLFSDVKIYRSEAVSGASGNDVTLVIEVTPEPTLGTYSYQGIKDSHRDDIDKKVPLLKGRPVRPSDLERTKQIIKEFYAEKGHRRATVDVERTVANNRVNLTFNVDRGPEVEVERIRFLNNEAFDDGDLRGAMEETRENRWWRFWKGEKFNEGKYENDLQKVVDFYNSEGYYDARVVSDSVYYVSEDGIGIDVTVEEGHRYYVADIEWEGNTVYPDRVLTNQLGLEEGEPYNGKRLEQNLFGNKKGDDVMGLYMDRGYMRANVEPTIRVVGEDSLDITLDVREGDVYTFGDIQISGNTKTKDHVIRRELYTVPGQRFSRSAIKESIRRLMQLKYFSKQSLAGGPNVDVDPEDKEANLTYDVEEVGSDQLELSGTWGNFGLVLQLGFKFNNFSAQNLFDASAWRPLPSGDGQQLGVNVRTNGTFYQQYSLSFTEPWFRGNPTPIGGSVSYARYTRSLFGGPSNVSDGLFQTLEMSAFFEQRLDWPDDKFSTGTRLGFRYYNNRGYQYVEDGNVVSPQRAGEPGVTRRNVGLFNVGSGINQSVTVRQSLTRNSLDNPQFPSRGAKSTFSVEVAPPIGDLVQYHKWRFKTNFNVPLGEKFSLGFGSDLGYIGSLTGDPVDFELFVVGGTPFDYSGFTYGTDPVFMRGYPQGVIGPLETRGRDGVDAAGARVMNKFTSEIRWMAIESQQLQARPYAFLDAAGAWASPDTYNPQELYRSAGLGVKLFLPIVGMIEFNYGYNFDTFVPIESGNTGERDWTFQFSLGRGFN